MEDSKEHLLALKVMRLTKPTFGVGNFVSCDSRDIAGDALSEVQGFDTGDALFAGGNFQANEFLCLPQNFGNIFLGETFSSYISVHNDSAQPCKDIVMKVELQTGSQRMPVCDTSKNPMPELVSDQSIDEVIHHEVKEMGTHVLVCAINYVTQAGEKLSLKKFFKFQVLKPLDVKTKLYNAETDEIYLETQIQNITPGPIYVERAHLEPSPHFTVKQLNTSDSESSSSLSQTNYLNPLDVRQYLFCLLLTGSERHREDVKESTSIGKLDITWRTNLGEKGRLQTSALQRTLATPTNIKVSVESAPGSVPLEKTFTVNIRFTNSSEHGMDVVLSLHNKSTSGLLWTGLSNLSLGSLAVKESQVVTLSLMPVQTGLLSISGLQLTDKFLKRTYEFDDITQVFVFDDSLIR